MLVENLTPSVDVVGVKCSLSEWGPIGTGPLCNLANSSGY